jgi:ABC-2 type transport system permease protein
MSLSTAARYLKLTWDLKVAGFQSAIEYRMSFIIQMIGILVNDGFWVLLWYFFFSRFQEIQGWTMHDNFLLVATGFFSFGLFMFFFYGVSTLAKIIQQGELDHYLTYPISALWYLSVQKFSVLAVGEMLAGGLILLLIPEMTLEKVGLFLIASILSAWIFFSFILVVQSLAFYVGGFERSADQIFWVTIGFVFYPPVVFSGFLKMITIFVIPAFFIYFMPVDLIRDFQWSNLGILIVVGIIANIASLAFYRRGLRKYESGNLISVKS